VIGSLVSISAEFFADAPIREMGIHIRNDKEPSAGRVVALYEQFVIFGEDMPHISDHGKPRCGFRRGGAQAGTVHGMIDNRTEFVVRHAGCQMPQRKLYFSASTQFATSQIPATSGGTLYLRYQAFTAKPSRTACIEGLDFGTFQTRHIALHGKAEAGL
jgi:hypothetical protein